MKPIRYTIALLISLSIILLLISNQTASEQVNTLSEQINDFRDTLEVQEKVYTEKEQEYQEQIDQLIHQINTLQQGQQQLQERTDFLDRAGDRPEMRTMEVTAYWEGSCGKKPDHPQYGITASGEYVKEWYTIAAGPELKIGTQVYIPFFKDKPNSGIFTVKDRGRAITDGHLDVYMKDYVSCMKFGRQWLEVYILD